MDTKRYNTLILTALLILLTAVCARAVFAHELPSNDSKQTIKVDVDLVLVNAAVTDTLGRTVTGIEKENFRLWEDKVEQKVEYFSGEDTPVSIGLIVDATGSMSDKISRARDAAAAFLKTGNPEDEYFLITFSQQPRLEETFTTDISRVQNHMVFTGAKGLTPLYDAVYLGLEQMKTANNKRKALLLITDGEDNHSRYSFFDVKQFLREQDVQLFAIGIVDATAELGQGRSGRANIEDLVETGGGRAFFPDSAEELGDICSKIGIELRNEYVLGYHSANEAKDGKWRKIRLKVNPPKGLTGLSVHARNGYYAEKLNAKP